MTLFSLLFFVSFLFLISHISANAEGDALMAFKNKLSDPMGAFKNWNANEMNPCMWFHVTCDINNNVIRLDLPLQKLAGPLAAELSQLKSLQYMELYGNGFTGTIPASFGDLTNLRAMDLYNNNLVGGIPTSFGKLKSLKFLRLNNNRLTGSVPREVANLHIPVLDVSGQRKP